MSIIVPAIIPTSKQDLEEKLAQLEGIAEDVQIDIVDGVYAGPASWPYKSDSTKQSEDLMLPHAGRTRYEIDLMAGDPESAACAWVDRGACRLTLHATSTRFLPQLIKEVRATCGADLDLACTILPIGLAIGGDTDTSLIDPYLEHIDYVQFMGIRTIGRQGEPFDARVLARIAAFRKKYPKIPVQVDGGVTLETAPKLLEAGVSRLVVGSALWNAPNLRERYEAFAALTEEYGLYS